jgi:hypothetical protein
MRCRRPEAPTGLDAFPACGIEDGHDSIGRRAGHLWNGRQPAFLCPPRAKSIGSCVGTTPGRAAGHGEGGEARTDRFPRGAPWRRDRGIDDRSRGAVETLATHPCGEGTAFAAPAGSERGEHCQGHSLDWRGKSTGSVMAGGMGFPRTMMREGGSIEGLVPAKACKMEDTSDVERRAGTNAIDHRGRASKEYEANHGSQWPPAFTDRAPAGCPVKTVSRRPRLDIMRVVRSLRSERPGAVS